MPNNCPNCQTRTGYPILDSLCPSCYTELIVQPAMLRMDHATAEWSAAVDLRYRCEVAEGLRAAPEQNQPRSDGEIISAIDSPIRKRSILKSNRSEQDSDEYL